jgi:hypothetical protein
MTGRFGYPRAAIVADYARASAGLVFAAMVLALPMQRALAILFAALALLLAAFAARTALRQASLIVLSDAGIALEGPLGRRIAWSELDGLKLRYFSMRRDRKRGWMELTLSGGGRRLSIESQIEGFEAILAGAAEAAAARRLKLDETTAANLAAFDVPSGDLPTGRAGLR